MQQCRRLAAGRGAPGEVLLDGPHLLQDAIREGVPVSGVLIDDRATDLLPLLEAHHIAVHVTSRGVLDAAAPVRTPSGVVAIAAWTARPAVSLLTAGRPVLIGLIGVQDPGNVGNVIRSADALGASGVLALDGTASPGGWKALRGAMGSTFRVPVGIGALDDVLPRARALGIRVAATAPAGGIPPGPASLGAPVLLLIGSEGAGLPRDVAASCDVQITIPMRSRVNSLNAATTAAIMLWEMTAAGRTGPDAPT